MAKHSITFYKIDFTTPVDKKDVPLSPCDISTFEQGLGYGLFDYCKQYTQYTDFSNLQQVLEVEHLYLYESKIDDCHNYYGFHCIVNTGEYGTDGDLVGMSDDGTPTKRDSFSKKDSVAMPFGWALYYSENQSCVILAIQCIGNHSILSLVKNIISKYLKTIDKKIGITIKPFIPGYYFDKELAKEIKELHIVKNVIQNPSNTLGERPKIFSTKTETIYYSPTIDKKALKKLKRMFKNRKLLAVELGDVANENEEVENVTVINKDGKTINFNRIPQTKVSIDISNKVEKKSGSEHPTVTSLFTAIDSNVLEYLIYYKISVKDTSQEKLHKILVYNNGGE